jgi:hypothetical protein
MKMDNKNIVILFLRELGVSLRLREKKAEKSFPTVSCGSARENS